MDTLQNLTKLYTTLQSFHNTLHTFFLQKLYKTLQNSTTLYTTFQNFTRFLFFKTHKLDKLHETILNFTQFDNIHYTKKHNFTDLTKLRKECTQLLQHSAKLYKTTFTKPYETSYTSIQLYRIAPSSIKLYKTLQHFTTLYKALDNFTILYKTLRSLHNSTQLYPKKNDYKTLQNFTKLCFQQELVKSSQNSTTLCNHIQNSTQLLESFTMLHQSPQNVTICHNFLQTYTKLCNICQQIKYNTGHNF